MSDNIKLYFVQFKNKTTSQIFYKFGITHHYDILKRFNDPQYDIWDIKVMASAYGPRNLVEQEEKHLLTKYPKNLWIEQKISGVTEIVNLSYNDVSNAIKHILNCRKLWFLGRK